MAETPDKTQRVSERLFRSKTFSRERAERAVRDEESARDWSTIQDKLDGEKEKGRAGAEGANRVLKEKHQGDYDLWRADAARVWRENPTLASWNVAGKVKKRLNLPQSQRTIADHIRDLAPGK